MNAITKEQDHAYQNAAGWASTIAELVAALECDYDRLETLRDTMQDRYDSLPDADESHEQTSLEHYLAAMVADGDSEAVELAELTAAATIDGDLQTDADSVRGRIQESPLSVEVRSGWYTPGSEDSQPEEFCILLSAGGPALRIRGELGDHNEPRRAWLEYQDWGTPWTEYHGEGCEQSTLLTFCHQFYYGE